MLCSRIQRKHIEEEVLPSRSMRTLLQSVKEKGEGKAPSFDHKVGDPIEDDIVITKQNKIVLVEGNYVLMQESPWNQIGDLLDERWFVACEVDQAMERVRLRHIGTGLSDDQARIRIEGNDRPNGISIQACGSRATSIIHSIDEPSLSFTS
eukprot:TRINITY_DN1172_c0_g1_i2.p1 TRINITY_DN1172_c0_g1~~TRINITY_DN1172_c0_g1_i2.p1  ORF type:complete len:151 (+),score=23.87 TRINITY_DN1172_c0_g1_i2:684-1136(+)